MSKRDLIANPGNAFLAVMANAEIKVFSTIATKEAYLILVPQFERDSGNKVTTTWAGTVDVMKRMAAGEIHDLIIISSTELDTLIKDGKIAQGSRLDIAKSGIGVAVRAGAPKPDIGSSEALKRTLLSAKTVGYTSGPSGIYMGGLVERMGIAAEVKAKFRSVPSGGTIGTIIASGDCEIGFQQVSELVHIKGIDYIGPLPASIQRITIFSSGVHASATNPDGAKALARFLAAPAADSTVKDAGLERP
jgi:molybdate transport system substrate-binding protein